MKKLSVLCVAFALAFRPPPRLAGAGGMGSHQMAATRRRPWHQRAAPGTNSSGTALSSSGIGRAP